MKQSNEAGARRRAGADGAGLHECVPPVRGPCVPVPVPGRAPSTGGAGRCS